MRHRSNGFSSADYETLLDTTISIRECLPSNHLARFVAQAISQLDLSHLHARTETQASNLHSPRILLGLLFYSYATGVLNSHEIERATYESVAFHYVAGGTHPEHRVIAEFRDNHLPEIQEAFAQILIFARTAGALKLGCFHLDKFNIFADAPETTALNHERLLELEAAVHEEISEILARAKNADLDEPASDLILEGEDAFQTNATATFARAKALLEGWFREHNSSKPVKRNGNQDGKSNGRQVLNCRTCAARQDCIETTAPGPHAKMAIERKFKNGTDNHEVWAKLQQNCLLTNGPQQLDPSTTPPVSGLIRRLYQLQQSPNEALKPGPPESTPKGRNGSTPHSPVFSRRPAFASDGDAFAITCVDTERIVRLPRDGAVVLGRFEPDQHNPPDVDLTLDDGIVPSVSRRHAQITAKDGAHWIEDMGSTNGTYRNGFPLALGERARLRAGDRILLGRCRLVYNPMPIHNGDLESGHAAPHIPVLTITHTGQSIGLPNKSEFILGRSDPDAAYTPDVDLSIADDTAKHVSSQHARLVEHNGQHYVENATGTGDVKINGRALKMGDAPMPLHHGDQLWLGGCVLAYEWKSFEKENNAFERILSRSMGKNGNAKRSPSTTQPTQFLTWHT